MFPARADEDAVFHFLEFRAGKRQNPFSTCHIKVFCTFLLNGRCWKWKVGSGFSVFPKQSPFGGIFKVDLMSEIKTLETFLGTPPVGL